MNKELINEQQKPKGTLLVERIKAKYPDKAFDNDEDLKGQIYDDLDGYETELNGYKEREKALTDMFNADPRSAQFLMNFKDGKDPIQAMIELIGETELRELLDDPTKQEQFAKAQKEYLNKVANNAQLEEQYKNNIEQSLTNLEQFQKENNLTEEDTDKVLEYLLNTAADVIVGKFSNDNFMFALKAINYDNDIENAEYEGEVRGKNTKIKEQLKRKSKNDGVGTLAGRNNFNRQTPQDEKLGALNNFGDQLQSIWERGGIKRTSYK